jgi:hypothetical protein
VTELARDILGWMRIEGRPVLPSYIALRSCGFDRDAIAQAFDELSGAGLIEARFPDAKPGDSGRQFWVPAL